MKNYTFIDYATQIYIILTSLFVLIGYNKLGSYWLLLFFIHFAVLITIHLLIKNQDKFKKGSGEINYNAREFVRELDLITDDNLFTKGASLGEGMGKLFILTVEIIPS